MNKQKEKAVSRTIYILSSVLEYADNEGKAAINAIIAARRTELSGETLSDKEWSRLRSDALFALGAAKTDIAKIAARAAADSCGDSVVNWVESPSAQWISLAYVH